MRLKFKYILILGLALGLAQTWWTLSHRSKPAGDEDDGPMIPRLKAYAREGALSSPAITPIPVTNWSVQLNAVINSGASTTNQAITLLAMFPNLPAEAQLEAAQHATRLMPGEYFGALGAQMTNSATAPAVRRAIFADLLTRPNALKLPWLVGMAQASLDTQSDEALFLLKSVLREDHGSNWNVWRERVAAWLTLHPDPVAPPNPGMAVSN